MNIGKTTNDDDKIDLCRPEKTGGISGSLIINDEALLFHCFTTNSDHFESGRTYTAFEVRKIIEFEGDNSACIRALVAEGYRDPLYGIKNADSLRKQLIRASKADPGMINQIRQIGFTKEEIKETLDWYEVGEDNLEEVIANSSKLKSHSLGDFLSKDIPETKMILDPIITESGMSEIHAYRGIGKTHVSIGIAVAVAGGGSFLRWQAPEAVGVIFVDGEMSLRELQDRFNNTLFASDGDIDEATDNLVLISAVDQELGAGIPCIGTQAGQEAIEDHINENTRLIILDNLSSLLRSTGSENDEQYWTPMVQWIVEMRKMNIAVLFIHHSGKGGESRGTSKREDLFDVVLKLKRPDGDYTKEQGARFEVHFDKARGVHGDDVRSFEAHLHNRQWTTCNINQATYDKVVELAQQGFNQKQISEKVGKSKGQVSKHLKKAREKGDIEVTETAKPGPKTANSDVEVATG